MPTHTANRVAVALRRMIDRAPDAPTLAQLFPGKRLSYTRRQMSAALRRTAQTGQPLPYWVAAWVARKIDSDAADRRGGARLKPIVERHLINTHLVRRPQLREYGR